MGGIEYWDTSFSFIEKESGQETFVAVPEMGGGTVIAEGNLPPGSVYTIGTDMLLKVNALSDRMQLAVESGAKRILIPSENKRDVADVPDAY